MERFSQRESVLLGYNNLPRPLMNTNPFSCTKAGKPFRNSDVDFQDVFGGPPRRFSMQEVRPVFGVMDDLDDGDDGGRPVFGEDGGAGRRKLPSADFFNDIFGGDAVANSPKRHGRDGGHVFPASPGSRALSPLPPQADPFLSSSPFTQFSLPAKVSKVQEIPTFGGSSSHSSSNSSPSRNSQSKLRDASPSGITTHSLSSANSLSRFSSELNRPNEKNLGESRPLFTTEEEEESNRVNNSKDSESLVTSTNVNGHFHFSIYKWAGKAHVPLDIPLRAKNGASSRPKVDVAKSEPFVGTDRNVNVDDDDCDNNNKSDNKTPLVDLFSSGLPLDEVLDEEETPSVVAKGIGENKEEARKPEVKSVHSLFYDDFERGLGEKKTMDKNAKGLSSPSVGYTKTTKKQDRKNGSEFEKVNGGVTFSPRRVKGKVREFVKIFNQDSSPKIAKQGFMSRSKSCKWNDKCTFEDDERIDSAREEEKLPKPKANEDLKQSAKVHASLHDNSIPSSDSFSEGSKATAEESDESFHYSFQVKELTQDENGLLESVTYNQEFQEIDAKIRQWTKGKEGNIRSLLSTLQFVLWVESGWKPVPLVDIIEGNAVKRAYQRALLCLHPDKLQQKGASSHQKYLAEKVFDILQEAWNYFNSLGAV